MLTFVLLSLIIHFQVALWASRKSTHVKKCFVHCSNLVYSLPHPLQVAGYCCLATHGTSRPGGGRWLVSSLGWGSYLLSAGQPLLARVRAETTLRSRPSSSARLIWNLHSKQSDITPSIIHHVNGSWENTENGCRWSSALERAFLCVCVLFVNTTSKN